MVRNSFRTVVKGLITRREQVLIGRKEEEEGHPISGEWHFLGGHLESGENVEAGVKREIAEETGLRVEVGDIVDVMTFAWGTDDEKNSLQILYHCRAKSADAEAGDDLQAVRWVRPEELTEYLFDGEAERLTTRPRQASFLADLTADSSHELGNE